MTGLLFTAAGAVAAQAAQATTESASSVEAFLASVTVFILALFLGVELISRVPTTLHTPLMSGTNAIHGIVLVGAMLMAGSVTVAGEGWLLVILSFIAVVFGAGNVVGGFVVTDRMLQMFKRKPAPGAKPQAGGRG
jgi:proton-translocating NAD(P)+ transhydrogenase subunit alpha